VRLPQTDPAPDAPLPPRRVRLLTEPVRPEPPPPMMAQPAKPAMPAAARPAPAMTARQKAAHTGVLAMGAALAELHGQRPRLATRARPERVTSPPVAAPAPTELLLAKVTVGSAGIDAGVGHRAVLGEAAWPAPAGPSAVTRGPDRVPEQASGPGPASGPQRSREEIQEILDRNKGAMFRLYDRELHRDGSLRGKLVVGLTIAGAGHVTRCEILSSDLDAAPLESQLVALIEGIDFGNKPGVAAVSTRVPIEFFPQ
jgi:hypothetical protein